LRSVNPQFFHLNESKNNQSSQERVKNYLFLDEGKILHGPEMLNNDLKLKLYFYKNSSQNPNATWSKFSAAKTLTLFAFTSLELKRSKTHIGILLKSI
jgi:hypothetical protein